MGRPALEVVVLKTETIEVKSIEDLLCDKCGKSLKHGTGEFACYEGTRLHGGFGYGSDKDGIEIEFDICDQCYDDFIGSFKHSPKEEEHNLADFFSKQGK